MAINRDDFINNIDTGLKANKEYCKFFLRFKIDKKTYYHIFDYSDKNWDKRTRINMAKTDSLNYKQNKINNDRTVDENIILDKFANNYFETMEESNSYSKSKWKNSVKSFYITYIKKEIGNKKIKDIRQMDIKNIIKILKLLELSARTQKMTLEIFNPVFKSAIANRIIIYNPCDGITISRPKQKRKYKVLQFY